MGWIAFRISRECSMYPAANPVDGIVTDPATFLRVFCRSDGQYGARAYLWPDMRAFVKYLGSAAVRP